jgi:hypothetical protein
MTFTWVITRDDPYESEWPKRKNAHSKNSSQEEIAEAKKSGRKFRVIDEDSNPLYWGVLSGRYTEEVEKDITDSLTRESSYTTPVFDYFLMVEFKKGTVWDVFDYENEE